MNQSHACLPVFPTPLFATVVARKEVAEHRPGVLVTKLLTVILAAAVLLLLLLAISIVRRIFIR